MGILFDKAERIGTDSGGYALVKVHCICDTSADLPAYNAYQANGYTLALGSKADVIDDGSELTMQANGTWVLTVPGQAAYTKSEIDDMISQIDLVRQGTEITADADLNDYEQIGAYYSPNSARTATLYNRPWSGSGFKMIVWSISSTSKMQWIMPMSNSSDSIFFRSRTTSGWRTWYQLQGTAVTTINPYP